jgi:hypothetical protein
MPTKRTLNERSLGKHIGHTCEGHFRGIISNLPGIKPEQVTRKLPFEFPVNPDLVLLNDEGKVRAVFVIAYWDDSKSSEKKFYRIRSEYYETLRACREHPEFFSTGFVIATVIYGTEKGWKEQILVDFANQCSPLIFLPDLLGTESAALIIERAFNIYRKIWESGKPNAREKVEDYFVEAEVSAPEILLLENVQNILNGFRSNNLKSSKASRRTVKVPERSIRTRLRQALGILSLFTPEEIEEWQNNSGRLATEKCEQFARRAFFLDMGAFGEAKTLRTSIVNFSLRRAVKKDAGNYVYAPELPDFEDWMRLEPEIVKSILESHRQRTNNPTSVFRGGTYDQIAGNWQDICNQVNEFIPQVINSLENEGEDSFVEIMCNEEPVTASDWHPAHQMAHHFPVWAFVVCSLAIAQDERKIRASFDARRQTPPSADEASKLFEKCLERKEAILNLLEELVTFSRLLFSNNLVDLTKGNRPRLLSLDEPCSWFADFYNTLTTNSSHNPLNEAVSIWLKNKFPNLEWLGWAERRSVSLQNIFGANVGRRQWQFLGLNRAEKKFVAGEVKSITQNHWGDKSKELYDRVAETRATAQQIEWDDHTVCVIDGDVSSEQLEELRTGIGHDEIVSVNEVIKEVFK